MTVETTKKLNKPAKNTRPLFDQEDTKTGDVRDLWDHMQANPLLYAAGVAVVLLSIAAGLYYRASSELRQRDTMTQYAKALENEDAAARVTALEPLTAGKTNEAPQALYMLGESAYEARQYDKAKAAYERLRAEFPDSPHVPDAVEGLGFIAENAGDVQGALAIYKEVLEKWPATFAGRRQNFNIGRCQEALGDFKAAKDAYDAQLTAFAGSSVYDDAKAALELLRAAHPDLFPAVTTAAPDAAPDAGEVQAPAATPEAAELKPESPAPQSPPEETPAPAPAAQ